MGAPYQSIADEVGDRIDGGAQASADILHFRSAYSDPEFLFDRMRELFAASVSEAWRRGYCRSLQKFVERAN